MAASSPIPESEPMAWRIAKDLAHSGHDVDLNGIVTHSQTASTLALTCLFGAIACTSGLIWPVPATVVLLCVVLSALADVDGGNGWVRRFITKDIAHTIIVWPSAPEGDDPNRPTLLITAPMTSIQQNRPVSTRWLLAPIALCLCGSLTVAGLQLWGPNPSIAIAITLLLVSVFGWAMGGVRGSEKTNAARAVWEHQLGRNHPPDALRVVWAIIGGECSHHDGMQTLLLNNGHRLSPKHTRILCLENSNQDLSLVGTEGWLRPRPSDPWLNGVVTALHLPNHRGSTPSGKAMRLGWRAATLCIAPDQQHRAHEAVHTVVKGGLACTEEGRW